MNYYLLQKMLYVDDIFSYIIGYNLSEIIIGFYFFH